MRPWVIFGAVFGLVAVASGAMGMHMFKATLATTGGADNFQLAQRYLMYHALALLGVGALTQQRPRRSLSVAGALFVIGTLLFCGSLFAFSLTGTRGFVAVTPFGGSLLMFGWLALAVAAWRAR